ncbi:hypothetical protein [Alkalibacterium sp. AK22]|uniref:hypothetical protein n=1 Tax=Alkalibacterium sp. AK22 TaxID=1229520 RepID=UPI0012DDB606|nr:hypothetical protein [Alkalibacterium sp. AK22]
MMEKKCPFCGEETVEEVSEDHKRKETSLKYQCESCGQTFGVHPTDPADAPEKHCDGFAFSYEGFNAGYRSIRIDQRDGYAELVIKPALSEMTGEAARFRIMLSEWQDIKQTLFYDLSVLSWNEDYTDYSILDGTQWHLRLEFDNQPTIEISGSNAYPALYQDLQAFLKPYFDQGDFELD